ncbi:MAG: alpha/beta fold hydrolase [Flavobacteriales bacterium]|nr:alpha/beta fold hydrolase [Flavobacteriales bacterium]
MNPIPVELENSDGTTTVVHQFGETTEASSVFVVFPAMGVYASYYQPLAIELAQAGHLAITADLRGNGHSSIRPSKKVDFSYADVLQQEYTTVLNHVSESFPEKKVFLFGHSLGGQLSCLFAARNSRKIDGLVLSATCSVYYKGWDGLAAYRILAGTQFANLVARSVGYFPGKKVGFGGTEAKSLIGDWSRQSRTGNYILKNDSFDYEKALSEVEIPVLALSYQGDSLSPVGAVEHLLDKLSYAQKEHIHLEKNDPRNDGYNHFNWAKKPKNVVGIVNNWLERID